MGTTQLVDILNNAGAFPSHYWKKGRSEYRESINASALHQRCVVKPHACPNCFMACGNMSEVKEGKYKGLKIEGPEYETIYAFGGLCEVKSIEEIMYLNDICDRYGIDTITAGNLCAFTIEASMQRRIDYKVHYGEVNEMAKLLSDITFRRGVGDTLAEGIRHAAESWDMVEQAIHVKGLEPAGYDPRVLKGMGLAYGTSPRGACHMRTTFYKPELTGMIDPDQIEGKAKMLVEWEDRLVLMDSLILCRFYRDLYQWEELNNILACTTGMRLSTEKVREICSNTIDATRKFNLREGVTSDEDHLPNRLYNEPLEKTNKTITREEMDILLQEYYNARGWDKYGNPL